MIIILKFPVMFNSLCIGEGNGTPLQYSCLENPMDGGAWWAAVHGVARAGHNWATSLSLFTFIHWTRKWQPTPVFLSGESQGWRSLVGCHLWGRTESDTTEATQQQQQQQSVYGRCSWLQVSLGVIGNSWLPRDTWNLSTGLEKVSFHSNPKERQCQRMFKLLKNYTHLTY